MIEKLDMFGRKRANFELADKINEIIDFINTDKFQDSSKHNKNITLNDILIEFEPMIFDFVESHNEENVRLYLRNILSKYFN
jgi:hypothetical protein